MDFYASQDRARRSTLWLVVFYLLSLTLLIVASSWVLLVLLRLLGIYDLPPAGEFYALTDRDGWVFAGVAGFILLGALISSYVKARELSRGGSVVALSLGARRIEPNTDDFQERQALNVVEEMAIASGMPVPDVYLLPEENAINAFAAGLTPTDAVIGLTRGAVEKLNRAQLQGVVGHEFSHILNGDMRLNIRLIMLITGIEFVGLVGRIFTQSSRSSRRYSRRRSGGRGAGAVILAGVFLRLIGALGVLFGRIIQAAVSRQREYLADASAVQFTRNSSAVADALKVIGGESEAARLHHTDTTQVAHLFFGQAFQSHMNFLFATHPPLPDRIKTLDPRWDGEYLSPLRVQPQPVQTEPVERTRGQDVLQTLAATGVMAESVFQDQGGKSSSFLQKIKEPVEAVALVVAMLLRPEKGGEKSALQPVRDLIDPHVFPGLFEALEPMVKALQSLPPAEQLPVIDVSMPALKGLSEEQYDRFKTLLNGVIDLDCEADVFEQTVYRLVTRFLDVHFGFAKPYKVRYRKMHAVAIEVQLLMSMLAHYGHQGARPAQIERAYLKGMQVAGFKGVPLADVGLYSEQDFSLVTEKLAHCAEPLKHRIMQGLMACARFDGRLAEVERELVLAISATMDSPIPRFALSP